MKQTNGLPFFLSNEALKNASKEMILLDQLGNKGNKHAVS